MNKQTPGQPLIYRLLVITGGIALLAAMAIDVIAVIGRATGIPLLGSIELVQAAVGIAGAAGLLVATIHSRHAMVRIIYNRLTGITADVAWRFNAVVSALFFIALCAGSVWLLIDLWHGQEETELWFIPYKPLRMLVSLALAAVAGMFAFRAWRGNRS